MGAIPAESYQIGLLPLTQLYHIIHSYYSLQEYKSEYFSSLTIYLHLPWTLHTLHNSRQLQRCCTRFRVYLHKFDTCYYNAWYYNMYLCGCCPGA